MSALNSLTLNAALAGLKSGQFSSRELVRSCLDQINKHDSVIHAFVNINDQAETEAKLSDQNYASGKPRLLEGIPVAVKDNFLTTGIKTTASARILENYQSPYNATVVSRLKTAGAIVLGKTNMDAWAHGSSTETSDFGSTKNPWNTGFLPGGSSGGSAAAVAADMCTVAIGSETAGSIRQPSSWCGVTGFKPTYGRVSRYGVIAMASSTDSPGPISKTVSDAALVTSVIAGQDPFDATTSLSPVEHYLSGRLGEISLKNLRIGIARSYLLPHMRTDVKQLITSAAKQFEQLGANVSDVSLIDPKYSIGVYTIIQRSEVSSNLARFDGIRYGLDRSHFGSEAKRRIMLGTYVLSSGYYDQYYAKAQKARTLIIDDFKRAFSEFDLIVGPTSPGPALPVGASQNQSMFGEMEDLLMEPSSIAGLTGISVPCGFVDGLPIGLQIIGPQFSEARVLQAALAYQSSTHWHEQHPNL